MNRVLIYTEGGFYLGLGNIYRMMELGKSLLAMSDRLHITFVTSSENYAVELIQSKGFEVKQCEIDLLPDLISKQDFNVLIIDKLGIEESFIQKVKNSKKEDFKVVIFGNITSANNISDLVVNAIIGTDFSNNNYVDKFGTRYLAGPKYLTLRSEFIHHSYIYRNAMKNILLLFGGSDQSNLSYKVLKNLLKSNNQYYITLVIGKGYKFIDELEIITNDIDNVKILRDISNVHEVMLANDFLITSPGTALFEGLYLGLPCLALYQNESQKEIFNGFFMTKSYEEIGSVSDYIADVYSSFACYKKELDELEIGNGKSEIINQIIELI